MRVDVWSGDQSEHLGEGELVGDVDVFFIAMPDGSLRSLSNAEERPDDSLVPEGGKIISTSNNPKIILNSGKVVYGCQVWWHPILSQEDLDRIERICNQVKQKLDDDSSLDLIDTAAAIVQEEFDVDFEFPVLDRVVKELRRRKNENGDS